MPGEDELLRARDLIFQGLVHFFNVLPVGLLAPEIDVEPGDTLWSLAEKHLGSGQRWRELYFLNYNNIIHAQEVYNGFQGTPHLIYAGTKLRCLAF